MACPVCKNDCTARNFIRSSFSVCLQDCHRKSVVRKQICFKFVLCILYAIVTANVFIILLFFLVVFLLHTQFVPCNIRHSFNESVGKTVLFRALGSTYNIVVSKGRSRTRLHGKGWEDFITNNNLNAGHLLIFTMT